MLISTGIQNGCVCNLILFQHVGRLWLITLLLWVAFLNQLLYITLNVRIEHYKELTVSGQNSNPDLEYGTKVRQNKSWNMFS